MSELLQQRNLGRLVEAAAETQAMATHLVLDVLAVLLFDVDHANGLKSVLLAVDFALDQVDLAEGPISDALELLVVVHLRNLKPKRIYQAG